MREAGPVGCNSEAISLIQRDKYSHFSLPPSFHSFFSVARFQGPVFAILLLFPDVMSTKHAKLPYVFLVVVWINSYQHSLCTGLWLRQATEESPWSLASVEQLRWESPWHSHYSLEMVHLEGPFIQDRHLYRTAAQDTFQTSGVKTSFWIPHTPDEMIWWEPLFNQDFVSHPPDLPSKHLNSAFLPQPHLSLQYVSNLPSVTLPIHTHTPTHTHTHTHTHTFNPALSQGLCTYSSPLKPLFPCLIFHLSF